MPSYQSDYAFGTHNQQMVRHLLNARFGGDHIEQPRYATFDFISSDDSRLAEVKSRRCASTGFPFALMGGNKIDSAFRAHPTKKVIFIWVYTDDTLYIEYDPVLFATFRRAMYQRGARDGIQDVPVDTVWVPIALLKSLKPSPTPASTTPVPVPAPSPRVAPLPSLSVVAT